MATQTRMQIEWLTGCIHEQMLQAAYQRQRRRIHILCEWMLPDAAAARRLECGIFVEAWGRDAAVSEDWPAVDSDRLAAAFAAHFEDLFHADVDAGAHPKAPVGLGRGGGLRAAIHELPARQRLLYLLHELEGYAPATLAGWLKLEPAYCSRLIHLARCQLAQTMAMAA